MSGGSTFEGEQAHLAAIVESSDDAILAKDLEGAIRLWNRGAERTYGYTAEEAVGRHVSFLFVPEGQEEELRVQDRIARGERIEHFRTRRRHKDGRVIEVSLTASPIQDAGGQIVGVSTISRDITAQIRTEEELAQRTAELQRSNAELERFAYIASHDLQEPLRTITSYVQLLARRYQGKLDDDADELIRYAVDGANRMRQLIQGLLAYARVHTRGDCFEPVPLEEILAETLEGLQLAIEESGATIHHGPLPVVSADPGQIGQVFANLIGNAIKFRSAEPPAIDIRAERQNDDWLFSFHDNGIGIDPQFFDRIFIVFQRLHSMAEYSGTGLGLALCKRIVQRHGGRIWVDSRPDRGSTFFFTLPADPAARAHGFPAGNNLQSA
jgi:PAS domain S-box-containing protein